MSETPGILERLARGDRAAATECIKEYSGLVWSLARRYFSVEADAEEAVQEIFMHLWQQAGRYDPARAEEVTFISLLARRRLTDRLRRAGRMPDHEPLDEHNLPISSSSEQALEQSADVARVHRALEALEPHQREVIYLSSWLGYSHGSIAQRLDLPLGTVKSHLRRGLIRVREQLGESPPVVTETNT